MWEVIVGGLPRKKNENCFQGTGKVTSLIKCWRICKSVTISRDCNKIEKTLLSSEVKEGRVSQSVLHPKNGSGNRVQAPSKMSRWVYFSINCPSNMLQHRNSKEASHSIGSQLRISCKCCLFDSYLTWECIYHTIYIYIRMYVYMCIYVFCCLFISLNLL